MPLLSRRASTLQLLCALHLSVFPVRVHRILASQKIRHHCAFERFGAVWICAIGGVGIYLDKISGIPVPLGLIIQIEVCACLQVYPKYAPRNCAWMIPLCYTWSAVGLQNRQEFFNIISVCKNDTFHFGIIRLSKWPTHPVEVQYLKACDFSFLDMTGLQLANKRRARPDAIKQCEVNGTSYNKHVYRSYHSPELLKEPFPIELFHFRDVLPAPRICEPFQNRGCSNFGRPDTLIPAAISHRRVLSAIVSGQPGK